jgi:hypothetical protein
MPIPLELVMLLLVGSGLLLRISVRIFLSVCILIATLWAARTLYSLAAGAIGIPQQSLYERGRDAGSAANGRPAPPPESMARGARPTARPPTSTRTVRPAATTSQPSPTRVAEHPTASVTSTSTRQPPRTPKPTPLERDVLTQAIAAARDQDPEVARLLAGGVSIAWAPDGYFTFCSFPSTVYWEGEILMNQRCPAHATVAGLIPAIKRAAQIYASVAQRGSFCRTPRYDWRACEAGRGPRGQGGPRK